MIDMALYITAFTTLFVVIDPIGLAPIFLALTQGMAPERRRAIGRRACMVGVAILFAFSLAGEAILNFVGISMPAFRVAGGVLLFLTALDMLFERRNERRESKVEDAEVDHHADDPSVFPLAIPLIAGPGAIATVILLTGQAEDWTGYVAVMAITLAVVGLTATMFRVAPAVERLMGKTGILVATRLLGMLLAALAVQFILDGLRNFGLMAAI